MKGQDARNKRNKHWQSFEKNLEEDLDDPNDLPQVLSNAKKQKRQTKKRGTRLVLFVLFV